LHLRGLQSRALIVGRLAARPRALRDPERKTAHPCRPTAEGSRSRHCRSHGCAPANGFKGFDGVDTLGLELIGHIGKRHFHGSDTRGGRHRFFLQPVKHRHVDHAADRWGSQSAFPARSFGPRDTRILRNNDMASKGYPPSQKLRRRRRRRRVRRRLISADRARCFGTNSNCFPTVPGSVERFLRDTKRDIEPVRCKKNPFSFATHAGKPGYNRNIGGPDGNRRLGLSVTLVYQPCSLPLPKPRCTSASHADRLSTTKRCCSTWRPPQIHN